MFQALAGEKGLSLSIRLAEDTPETIETDQQRLEQVLNNLLSNAIKFTERGGVLMDIGRASDGRIAFAVRDTGIGIAEDHLHSLFHPFTQAEPHAENCQRGTGLGLAICRQHVDLMGGRLDVVSTSGAGSTFTFGVPLGHADDDGDRVSASG
jgi:signal transduction histidine kinase